MLKLKGITKDYQAGDGIVRAIRGIDLEFRQNEYVSILGPSGSGKTTLLNIIGGLDQYTQGDLIINGISTKNYEDKDWDAYRNYSIGFVFQSYNLIPHQTVLQNVEIALTLSGVSKEERRARAIKVLEDVGLGDQLNKRPNQMSGGQMQRVAIARALVNDPDIILADEPTGALDTETSYQVLDLLKEIASDRLIIMVTHNAKLANHYSTRIIKMLDGKIIDDSRPLTDTESPAMTTLNKRMSVNQTPSMSFATSFMLSLKNLFTKKGRTTLTALAGSIGIMGIALVIAISQGTSHYIDSVQEDALSSYPLTIEKTNVDMSALMEAFMNVTNNESNHENDAVYKKSSMYDMITAMNNIESTENDLKSFKHYLETEYNRTEDTNKLKDAITGIQYTYNLDLNVFTKSPEGAIIESNTQKLLQSLLSEHMGQDLQFMMQDMDDNPLASMQNSLGSSLNIGVGGINLWQEMLPGDENEPINDVLKKQYDVVYGQWPTQYNEIVLVLDKNNELNDITLYALGLETKANIDAMMKAALDGEPLIKQEGSWSYQEILDNDYRIILNSNRYVFDEHVGHFIDLAVTETGLRFLYDDALLLKVTGIIKPNEDAEATMLSGSIAYTHGLIEHIIKNAETSEVVKAQQDSPSVDVLNNLPFKTNTENLSADEKREEFVHYVRQLDEVEQAEIYLKIKSIPSAEQIDTITKQALMSFDREIVEQLLIENIAQNMGVDQTMVFDYIESMSDEDIEALYIEGVLSEFKGQFKEQVSNQLAGVSQVQLVLWLDQELNHYTSEEVEVYYDEIVVFSQRTLDETLMLMGQVDLDTPSAIHIYASSFQNKDVIEETIKSYNEDVPELSQIKYVDYLAIIMSSIKLIINAITYVLLAFIGISLVVSSIMIGVITLISVQERTKEIGILRAIGASKSNVASLFNAETIIIGLASGLLGVVVTLVLTLPINAILHKVTNITNLKAQLPWSASAVLILISIILSLFAGIIPSRSAAKKDPVVALRSE